MKPKILVSRKISDLAEEKLQKEFEATLNPKDEPIPESELIKLINDYDGMIINAAAFTHTSVAIRDALELFKKPIIEMHISNIYPKKSVSLYPY